MKKIIAFFLCALLTLSLFGCSDPYDTPYVPSGSGLTWDDEPLPESTTNIDQSLTLTYYPDRTMNPILSTDFTNRALFSLMYQGLFATDRNYQVSPRLCRQYHRTADMKTHTFYIENARYHNGTTVTIEDVLASLEAARDSSYYGGRFTHISKMGLSDDGALVINTSVPMENLPILLDIPIIPQLELTSDLPAGSGPYYLDNSTQIPLLRRTQNWWCRAEMVITAPAISLHLAQSISDIRDSFEFEGLSLVCADPSSDRYADYRCDYELWDCETGIFLYLACNVESEVFSNENLRAALTYAIDRDSLSSQYYRGFARSASLPASPQSPYYSHSMAAKYAYDGGEKFTQAVADARKTEIVFLVNKDDSLRLRVARDIAAMLTNCGMKVTMSELSTANYKKALKSKEYDLYLGQTKLSPNMDLSAFFSNKGALNYGALSDVALYSLCTESLANHGNYYTLHKKIMDDGRLCPVLFCSYAVYAERGLLTGLTPSRDAVFYYNMGKTLDSILVEG